MAMVPIKKVNPTRSPVFIAEAASIVVFSPSAPYGAFACCVIFEEGVN